MTVAINAGISLSVRIRLFAYTNPCTKTGGVREGVIIVLNFSSFVRFKMKVSWNR